MCDPNRPLSSVQAPFSGIRHAAPVGSSLSTTIPLAPNSYGMISSQPHQFISPLTYTQLPNAHCPMPLVGSISTPVSNIYVPVPQATRTPILMPQIPAAQVPASLISQTVDPVKFHEQQKKLERERNFHMQQQRLKQFTIAGNKGNFNADNLIDSMFGKSLAKENSLHSSQTSKLKETNENKIFPSPVIEANTSVVHQQQANVFQPSVEPHSNNFHNAISKTVLKKGKKEIDAMMLECSDLKGPQKANTFSKTTVKNVTMSTQPHSTFITSTKARNWNNIQGLNEIFIEKKSRFPAWCCKENVPDLFKKVESIVTENGTHTPETNLLYPILMSSNLPQQSLAHIWELVNLSAPGYLTVEEMYAALALVAVAQVGHAVHTADILHQLPSCPVPQLQYFINPPNVMEYKKETSIESPSTSADIVLNDSLPPGISQLNRPSTIPLKEDNSLNSNTMNIQPNKLSISDSATSKDDEFDDFKSATPTCINFCMYPTTAVTNSTVEDDEFDDFKAAPTVDKNVILDEGNKLIMNDNNAVKSPLEETDLISPEEDKYSVFRFLQQSDSTDRYDFNSISSNFEENKTDATNNTKTSSEETIKIEPFLAVSENREKNISEAKKDDDDEFGEFLHAHAKQATDVSAITNKLEDMNPNFADFSKFEEKETTLPALSVSSAGQIDDDDEFGEFASSLPVSTKSDVVVSQEFLFCHMKDNISLAESQSVSSLELGTFDGGGHSGESKSSLSRQGSIPSLDLKTSCLETNEGDDGFTDYQASPNFNRLSKNPSPAVDSKGIEHGTTAVTVTFNFQTTKSAPFIDKYSVIRSEERKEEDLHISSWTRCLQSAVKILQNTKKIFNQMSSSSVCNEIISSEEGGNYIKDVTEVYKIVCKIKASSKNYSKQTITISDLLKEAEQAWNTLSGFFAGSPLMPQESSFNFFNALLNTDSEDNIKACGLCLLNIEIQTSANEDGNLILSYGGRNYHNTCANFWVNCVEPLLPALNLPQLL